MLEKVEAYRAWTVVADYDANAPEGDTGVLVATEDLAVQLCKMLNEQKSEDEMYDSSIVYEGQTWELSLPYTEGHEWCKSYCHKSTLVVDPNKVANTVAGALSQLGEVVETESGD